MIVVAHFIGMNFLKFLVFSSYFIIFYNLSNKKKVTNNIVSKGILILTHTVYKVVVEKFNWPSEF